MSINTLYGRPSGWLPLDSISNIPDLVRLVKEVNRAKQPQILKQDREPVAVFTCQPDLAGLAFSTHCFFVRQIKRGT